MSGTICFFFFSENKPPLNYICHAKLLPPAHEDVSLWELQEFTTLTALQTLFGITLGSSVMNDTVLTDGCI